MAEPNGSGRYFDQSQYDFLKQCSEKGEEGIKEWNEWRSQNPTQDIYLDGRDLSGWHLRGINLMQGKVGDALFTRPQVVTDYSGQVYLRRANFGGAHAERGTFSGAHLEGSCWWYAKAQGAVFSSAKLNDADLGTSLLDECRFDDAALRGAGLTASSLRSTNFTHSDLRGCSARAAITDGATIIWECMIDKETDFTGVGLDGIRVDAGTKQALEYAVRRRNWERWYRVGKPDYALHRETGEEQKQRQTREVRRCMLTLPIRLFWFVSDYGRSTGRIVVTFFVLALAFAAVYYLAAVAYPPGIVSSLLVGDEGPVPAWLVPVRAIYFSVVTMTTLGFGDMHANCQSFWGHVLLTLQVLLGYLLLGALVTRFAVLFTAGGPAGRFIEHESEKAITERKAGEGN